MYVGTHSNSYLASVSASRGTSVQQLSTSKAGQGVFVSAPRRQTTVANNASTTYLSALKNGASSLKKAIEGLTSGKAFKQSAVTSSDKDALTVKQKSGSAPLSEDLTVKISQLATTQKNEGKELNPDAIIGSSGTQEFAINVGGKEHKLSVSVSATDSNRSVQNKLANAINSANIGVEASVSVKNGKTALNLESAKTGDTAENRFSIRDVSGSLVSKMGLDNTTQEAQDAVYSVNGESRTSNSNTVDLGSGVTATLKKATKEEITVSQGTDTDAAISAVQDLVDSYNGLLNAANRSSDSKAANLLSDLLNVGSTYVDSLNRIGINFNADGSMSINEGTMSKAAEDGTLQSFFETSNSSYGFTAQLGKIANNADRNLGRYVGSDTLLDAGSNVAAGTRTAEDAATYKSLLANSGYGSAWNIANMHTGILFNSLIG